VRGSARDAIAGKEREMRSDIGNEIVRTGIISFTAAGFANQHCNRVGSTYIVLPQVLLDPSTSLGLP
jgi:hypothetical protein